ncbi:hypothetical protein EB796_021020 [Bugula neritina]|uniref:Uncharacterized protein n=1 Tax=Bugula neritina TaxID=10212 RepID=A0A7J7J389_BUGNE|nr:hypothetical protein EB796_021020 [Bugula neritina]
MFISPVYPQTTMGRRGYQFFNRLLEGSAYSHLKVAADISLGFLLFSTAQNITCLKLHNLNNLQVAVVTMKPSRSRSPHSKCLPVELLVMASENWM